MTMRFKMDDIPMRFKVNGEWRQIFVRPFRIFEWQGLNFVLHKNFEPDAKYRLSHKESGLLIWAGDDYEQVKEIGVGLMEEATKGGVAKSILKELGV